MKGKELIEDIYPLTPLQQGMLFHSLYRPEAGEYFEQVHCRLRGVLDVEAFRAAWQGVIDRHGALRICFRWEKRDEPLQVVIRAVELPLQLEDWREVGRDEQQRRLEQLLRSDVARGFELGKPPLLRLVLVRTADGEHLLLWSHHHLLLDGWSVSIVLHEVLQSYRALCDDAQAKPALPPPYRDYVAWLRRRDLGADESFWRRELAGFESPTPLPMNGRGAAAGPGPWQADQPYRRLERRFGAEESRRLQDFARAHGLTLNSLFLGAWGLLLSRFCGQRQVVFGVVTSGRPADLPAAESIVGLLVNTLPLKLQVPARERALDWLRSLGPRLAEVRRHEHTPLPNLRRWIGVPADVPLFETLFAFENQPPADLGGSWSGIEVCDVQVEERTHYPLTLTVLPAAEIGTVILFDRRRCSAADAGRLLDSYSGLVKALAADPGARLAALPLVSEEERGRLLALGRGEDRPLPARCAVNELFDAQVERSPDAEAVRCEGHRLTYRELQRAAEAVALRLQDAGIGPEDVVPVLAQRSIELIAGILGIVKAGAAYLPLDPTYPAERLRVVLDDSRASVILLQEALIPAVEAAAPASALRRVSLDLMEPPPGRSPARPGLHPDSLLYVMYTSGSTGVPKGSAVCHRGVANMALQNGPMAVRSGDRMAQFSTISFDAATWEIWGTLLVGGCLVVTPREELLAPEALEEYLRRGSITAMLLTTTLFNQVARERPSAVRGLRTLLFGGEAADAESLRRLLRSGSPENLLNVYGPTEATVITTVRAPGGLADAAVSLPVGRPVENYRVVLVDRELSLVPVGVPGEILIGGEGVGRGYYRRPRLTAERFIPDPFGSDRGGRLYRSGDLGRWLEDGEVEFVERRDRQVKVRGFRVELGEIEAALRTHGDVREAAVIAPRAAGDGSGPRRLIAYVAPVAGASLGAAELRSHLETSLPAHMLPASFIVLDRLPLTLSGKVDLRALPELAAAEEGVRAGRAPRGTAEETLARVWKEVLGLEAVGVEEDFFELGGDSILSIQICSRLAREGLRLTPRQIFEEGSIERLAQVLETYRAAPSEEDAAGGGVPLTPVQRWFFELELADPAHFNQGLAVSLPAGIDATRLEKVLQALEEHHEALRLRFRRDDGRWVQEVSPANSPPPRLLSLELEVLRARDQEPELERIVDLLQTGLNLVQGPIWRVALVSFGAHRPPLLAMVVHHLAVDAVSWRILFEDLAAGYRALAAGERRLLPPRCTTFRRWAQLLEESSRGAGLEAEAERWLELLAAAPAEAARQAVALAGSEGEARTLAIVLGARETGALLRRRPGSAGGSVEEVLLGALTAAWGAWGGGEPLFLHLERHGREAARFAGVDLTRTVGWFTSLVPVVLEPPPDPGDLVTAVAMAGRSLRALPGGGFGWGLMRYLGDDPGRRERLGRLPQPAVSFNYLGQLDGPLQPGSGLEEALLTPQALPEGSMRSPRQGRAHWLDVSAEVSHGELRWELRYGRPLPGFPPVAELASELESALHRLAETFGSAAKAAESPPFDLAGIAGEELEDVLSEVEL